MKISIDQIKKEMPEGLEPIEKVRYLYLRLGNILSYNRDYLNIENITILKDIYNDYITLSMIEEGDYQNKIIAICKQHSEILAETINSLNDENIKAITAGYDEVEGSHITVIVEIEEKGHYCLEINKDLYKIQKGMKTKGFAVPYKTMEGIECNVLSDDEIKNMDEKLGYYKYGMYTDDVIQMLKNEMEQETNWEQYNQGEPKSSAFHYKIDFIFKHLRNNQLDEMEIFEVNKFYKMLYYRLTTEEERSENYLNRVDILINKNGKQVKSLLYEIQREEGNLYYIYSHEEKTFVEISKQQVIDFQENKIIEYEGYCKLDLDEQGGER